MYPIVAKWSVRHFRILFIFLYPSTDTSLHVSPKVQFTKQMIWSYLCLTLRKTPICLSQGRGKAMYQSRVRLYSRQLSQSPWCYYSLSEHVLPLNAILQSVDTQKNGAYVDNNVPNIKALSVFCPWKIYIFFGWSFFISSTILLIWINDRTNVTSFLCLRRNKEECSKDDHPVALCFLFVHKSLY